MSTRFKAALEALVQAHNKEIQDLQNDWKDQLDTAQRETSRLLKRIQELEEQNKKLLEENRELRRLYKQDFERASQGALAEENGVSKEEEGEQIITIFPRKKRRLNEESKKSLDLIDLAMKTDSESEVGGDQVKKGSTIKLVDVSFTTDDDSDKDEARKLNWTNPVLDETAKIPPVSASLQVQSEEYSVVDLAEDEDDDLQVISTTKKYKGTLYKTEDNKDKDTPAKKKKEYKYVEVVRKKEDRAALPGRECEQCSKFFDAIDENGGKFDRAKFVHQCSRHRERFSPPSTPPDFWQVSFPETQDHG